MGTAFATEAEHVRDLGHLETADIARATGADLTTVRAWLRDARSPSGRYAERLAELSFIVERLAAVMRPDYIRVWLLKPNAAMADDKPIDLIARGKYRSVSRGVAALESTPVS
jgi:transcriptional regulator with XRE-family HTH domain